MLIKWTAAKEGTEEKGNHCNDKGTNIEWKRHNLRGDLTQKKLHLQWQEIKVGK